MASYNFSTRFNFWTKERIGWGRRSAQKFFPSNAIDYSPPHYWQGWVYLVFIHNLCISICVFALLIIPPSLFAGLSASAIHSVFTKDLSVGTLDPFVQRDPNERQPLKIQVSFHIVHFSDFSLSLKKEKSQHISTGTAAVALIWGIFCKIPQFKVFVGSKLLVFGKKKKIYFGFNSFSGWKEKILLRSLPKTLKACTEWPDRNYE